MGLLDKITDWMKESLISGITSNFNGMFDELNTRVGEIATQVGQTPQNFNSGIFNMIKNLSDTVVIPIAGMILTFVICYELIHMFIDQNNLHNLDSWIFFKWTFKTLAAVFILTHVFDIVMGIFGIGQHVVNMSAGIISGNLNMNLAMTGLQGTLEAMEWGELLGLYMESIILSLAMKAMALCIFIIVYGRMLEVYLSISVAPIPFATMVNHEWGTMGKSYLKTLFALAFQGFLIMVCVAIYAVLLQNIPSSTNIHADIWQCTGFTLLLCMVLAKTGSISKGIFAH